MHSANTGVTSNQPNFDASKVLATGFKATYSVSEGLTPTLEFEFVHPRTDDVTFKTEQKIKKEDITDYFQPE